MKNFIMAILLMLLTGDLLASEITLSDARVDQLCDSIRRCAREAKCEKVAGLKDDEVLQMLVSALISHNSSSYDVGTTDLKGRVASFGFGLKKGILNGKTRIEMEVVDAGDCVKFYPDIPIGRDNEKKLIVGKIIYFGLFSSDEKATPARLVFYAALSEG